MLDRHDTRAAAFKALFALVSNPEANRSDVYEEALPAHEEAPAYLTTLVDGVLAHQDELDAQISAKLKKRLDAAEVEQNRPHFAALGSV